RPGSAQSSSAASARPGGSGGSSARTASRRPTNGRSSPADPFPTSADAPLPTTRSRDEADLIEGGLRRPVYGRRVHAKGGPDGNAVRSDRYPQARVPGGDARPLER